MFSQAKLTENQKKLARKEMSFPLFLSPPPEYSTKFSPGGGAPPGGPTPHPFTDVPFLTEKVPLTYTFH